MLELSNFEVKTVDRFDILSDMAVNIDDVSCDDLGLDFRRAVRIEESIVGVVEVIGSGCNADNHDCLAIATKGEFEQARELAVAIVGTRVAVERRDDVVKFEQGASDEGAFETLVGRDGTG